MKQAPIPKNEKDRLISLHTLGLLDTKPEERFDRITRTATKIFHAPISTLTLVDEKREWFKSVCGLDQREGDRAISFCGHALLANEIFVIPDTKKDLRFSDNPMVIGKPYIRFYAGVPIMNADGQRVGVFCIKDTEPRAFSKDDEDVLVELTAWVELEINSRNLSLALAERKKVEQNLIEEKAKNEAILASIGDAVMACDKGGVVMLFNGVAEKLTGFSVKEVINHHYSQSLKFIRESDEKPGNDFIAETIKVGQGKKMENHILLISKNGRKIPVADSAAPIKNAQGEIVGCVLVFRDMTKDREIDRAKTEFVSLASHQLRTPLGIMKWYLEALGNEEYFHKAPGAIRKYFDEIYKSNERVLSLVRDLLSVSRIDQGWVKNVPQQVDVLGVVREIVEQMQIVAHKKKVTLRLTISNPKIPPIMIDLLRLQEVLKNLIANAIEYTMANGSVDVTVRKTGGRLSVRVQDTGIGISEADQKKIFSKFFRSEEAVSNNPEGSGLGLYVVQSYVEGWGGTVSVKSSEGKGSTFTIDLPISQKNDILKGKLN